MCSVFFTYPLEVIRVRMAFQTRPSENSTSAARPSLTRALHQIYYEHSVVSESVPRQGATVSTKHIFNRFPALKFYRGFTATITGMIPYAGVSFLSWGYLHARLLPDQKTGRAKPTPLADLAIGAVSGAMAQTVSYPFEVIRRRMQVGGITHPDRWLRWEETVRGIWRSGGWKGFYVGLSIGYLKVVPMTAVSFAVWQGGKRLLGV